jgi:hypothetical protein
MGGDSTDFDPVPALQAQKCLYSTKSITGKSDDTAELLQAEASFILLPRGTDVQKGDEIRAIRHRNSGDVFKPGKYSVETFSEKPSMITGPHHVTATLKEIP